MELFKSNDSRQLAYIFAPAGFHAMPTAIVRWFVHDMKNHHKNVVSNVIISEGNAIWMNVHFNPFSIWNSFFFQTELPALLLLVVVLLLGLENKEQPWYFLLNPTLH